MSRPIYETAADQSREEQIAHIIESIIQQKMIKMAPLYFCDYQAWWNSNKVNIEIKYRDIYWGQYKDIILSAHKARQGWYRYTKHGEPFIFVVFCKDGLFRYRMTRKNAYLLETTQGGRIDRGDPRDIEKVIRIPIEFFSHF